MMARAAAVLGALALLACQAKPEAQGQPVKVHAFDCESQRPLRVSYPTVDTATVEYAGQTIQMTIAVSASGARYVGGGLQWWTKGQEGSLFRQEGAGDPSGPALERCTVRRAD